MDLQERRTHLMLVLDELRRRHAEWVQSDAIAITEELQQSIEEVGQVFDTGDIPGDCRELQAQVAQMGSEWEKFRERRDLSGDLTLLPGDNFWHALEVALEIRQKCDETEPVPIESLATLEKQGVPPRQICLIYGWILPDGRPDYKKLREEQENPGTHINEDFISPAEAERRKAQRETDEAIARIKAARAEKIETAQSIAPEPIEELIMTGVSAKQIATMKRCGVDEVWAAADAAGLERPPLDYDPIQTERGTHARDLTEEEERVQQARAGTSPVADEPAQETPWYDQTASLETQIIQLARPGTLKHSEIAEILTDETRKVSYQKVRGVLMEFRKRPEAFAQ